MRRTTLWLMSTIAALVLLFSYKTSTNSSAVATPVTISTPADSHTPGTSSTSAAAGGDDGDDYGGATTSPTATATTTAARTYTGSTASTRWGDVQVAITVSNGKITDVKVPVYPSGNHRDQEINAYALPILIQETVTVQSANIDSVSGATVTSDGYRQSLQSALDAAHLS